MKYHKFKNGLVYIKKACHTCEFNFGVCAAGSKDGPYDYGQEITDKTKICGNYEISFHEYCNLSSKQEHNFREYLY